MNSCVRAVNRRDAEDAKYDTGATPRVTFGPNRRVGAAGAHVVSINVAEKEFAIASGWIKAY